MRRPLSPILFASIACLPTLVACRGGGDEVRLNELALDPIGVDGVDSPEWVEIYNAGDDETSLDGWRLVSEGLDVLATLGDVPLAGGGYLLIRFEDEPESPTEGVAYAGTRADALPSGSGGLMLLGPSDADVVDYVAWSRSEPHEPGSAEAAAVEAGLWSEGDVVELAITGRRPLLEGETLGRDRGSARSGSSADWDDEGGADAVGATPGAANRGGLLSSAEGTKLTQGWMNDALIGLGLRVTDASFAASEENEGETFVEQEGTHSFEVVDTDGASDTYEGTASFLWTQDDQGAWTVSMVGTLTSGDQTVLQERFVSWSEDAGAVSWTVDVRDELVVAGESEGLRRVLYTGSSQATVDGAWIQTVEQEDLRAAALATYVRTEAPTGDDLGWEGGWTYDKVRRDGSTLSTDVAYTRKRWNSEADEILATPSLAFLPASEISTYDIHVGDALYTLAAPAYSRVEVLSSEIVESDTYASWLDEAGDPWLEIEETTSLTWEDRGETGVWHVVSTDAEGEVREGAIDPLNVPLDIGLAILNGTVLPRLAFEFISSDNDPPRVFPLSTYPLPCQTTIVFTVVDCADWWEDTAGLAATAATVGTIVSTCPANTVSAGAVFTPSTDGSWTFFSASARHAVDHPNHTVSFVLIVRDRAGNPAYVPNLQIPLLACPGGP